MGVTSVSTGRQVGAGYLLLDSGAHLHACAITYPGQKIPLPEPGIPTGDIQTSRRTNSSSAFPRVCISKTNSVSWPSRSAGVLHCSFLTRSRRNRAKHSHLIIPSYVIMKGSDHGARHGPTERQRMYYKAKEMLQKARQSKHEGYETILERYHKIPQVFVGYGVD